MDFSLKCFRGRGEVSGELVEKIISFKVETGVKRSIGCANKLVLIPPVFFIMTKIREKMRYALLIDRF